MYVKLFIFIVIIEIGAEFQFIYFVNQNPFFRFWSFPQELILP